MSDGLLSREEMLDELSRLVLRSRCGILLTVVLAEDKALQGASCMAAKGFSPERIGEMYAYAIDIAMDQVRHTAAALQDPVGQHQMIHSFAASLGARLGTPSARSLYATRIRPRPGLSPEP